MVTTQPHISRGARRRTLSLSLLLLIGALAALMGTHLDGGGFVVGMEGTVERVKPSKRPAVEAAFPRESYRRGAIARLVISSRATDVRVQLFRAGTELERIEARDEMRGTPVNTVRRLGDIRGRRSVVLRIGEWPSGLYYARLTADGGRIGYAPFVLRPNRLGEHRVAVVLPTFSWQAYNFHDDDADGDADTWYDGNDERLVKLGRPYENRGVPPHYKYYDQPFLRWLSNTGREVDYLSDSDLDAVTSGRRLQQAYELVVFPGHHEYATMHEFNVVREYRDRGGNLMFLSANNFYWWVIRRGDTIRKVIQFRKIGKPEAAFIGVQYVGNGLGEHRGPWIVRNTAAAPWLFSGTGLSAGSELSSGGIEIDAVVPGSPRNVRILADIPNVLGPGKTAHMSYYETPAGAKVFAAGAFTLAGAVWNPQVRPMMENLWARLAQDRSL